MGLFDNFNFKNIFNKDKNMQTKAIKYYGETKATHSWIGFRDGYTYDRLDESNIIKDGYLSNEDIYSIINFISNMASNMDYKLKEKGKDGSYQDVDENDDLYKLFKNPNKDQTITEYMQSIYISYLLTGSAYQLKEKITGFSIPDALHLLPTRYVEPYKNSTKFNAPIKGYTFSWEGQDKNYSRDKVIQTIMYDPSYKNYKGLSPLQSGRMALKTSNSVHASESYMIENNGASGVISSESDTYQLTPEERELLDENFKKRVGGSHNYNKIVTVGNKINYTEIGKTPKELDLSGLDINKLRKFCNIYGINSQIFNDPSNKTFNNLSEAKKSLYTDVLIPLVEKFIDSFNNQMIKDINEDMNSTYLLTLDTSKIEVLQKDKKEEATKNKILADTILNVTSKISIGELTKESGIQILVYSLGMALEDASNIINSLNILDE